MENPWVNPRWLKSENIENFRRQYRFSVNKLIIIDDFFSESARCNLTKYLCEVASYENNFAIIDQDEIEVDSQTFEQTDPNYRFYTHQSTVDRIPDNPFDSSYIAYLKFQTALDQELSFWFSRITSERHCNGGKTLLAKFSQKGDILNWHHDAAPGRNLCVNIYLSEQWLPDKGGLFLYKDVTSNAVNEIAPLANRCVMFDPRQKLSHRITSICTEGWKRYAITFWYKSNILSSVSNATFSFG